VKELLTYAMLDSLTVA